jgi:hypothetical protein
MYLRNSTSTAHIHTMLRLKSRITIKRLAFIVDQREYVINSLVDGRRDAFRNLVFL